ncbi:MAG: hypothetical protein Q9157_002049 [Trypethelium eluteriae]
MSTKHNTLSNGRKYQDFNAGGTTQTTITYATALNASATRVLVYPSSLTDYVDTYEVIGPIKTTDVANGQPTCMSEELLPDGGATFTLPAHPSLNFASIGANFSDNPLGTGMTALISTVAGVQDFFASNFPGQVAFSSCQNSAAIFRGPGRISAALLESMIEGVAYLTLTSTTHTNAPPPNAPSQAVIPHFTPEVLPFAGASGPAATPGQSLAPISPSNTVSPTEIAISAPNTQRPNPNTAPVQSDSTNPAGSILPILGGGGNSDTTIPTQTLSNPPPALLPSIINGGSSQNSASNPAPISQGSPSPPPTQPTASAGQLSQGQSKPSPSIIVGSTVIPVATSAKPTVVAGSSTAIPVFGVGSSTIALGQTGTISNTPVAFITSGDQTHIVVGGSSTTPLAAPTLSVPGVGNPGELANTATPAPSPITIGSQTLALNPQGQYTGNGQTIGVGSTLTLGSGPSQTKVGLQTDGVGNTQLVVGESTSQLLNSPSAPTAVGPVLRAAGQSATPNSQGQYIVAGQTVAPGSTIVVSGISEKAPTTIALQTNNAGQTAAVINGQTFMLSVAPTPSPLVIGSQTVQPNAAGQFVVSGFTLTPGATATIPGAAGAPSTTVALQTNSGGQTEAVINGQTSPLSPTPTAVPLYVGGQTIYPDSQSRYVISGQTITPGATATIPDLSGGPPTTVGLSTDGSGHLEAVVNGRTSTLTSSLVKHGAAPIDIDDQAIYPNAQSQYIVSGKTLTPGTTITIPGSNGGPASTIALQIDSAGHTEAVINGQTSTIDAASPITSAPLTIDGQAILPNAAGQYVLSGRTLNPGSTITVPGVDGSPSATVALQTDSASHTAVVINGQTSTLSSSTPITAAPLFVGGETLLPNSAGSYIVSGQTLTPGSTITIPGDSAGAPSTTIILTTDVACHPEAIVNGQTATLAPSPIASAPLVLSPGGESLLPNAAGVYIVDGKTLSVGGQITIPGNAPGSPSTTIALTTDAAGEREAIINGRTTALTPLTASVTAAPIVVGGQTITPDANGEYVIGGKTLSLDGEVTLGSRTAATTVELTTGPAGQTEVVVGGSTSTLPTLGPSTMGVGGYIMSGGPPASTAEFGSGASGGAGVKRDWAVFMGLGWLMGVIALVL